jgi:predicted nucleic acid-binding protein
MKPINILDSSAWIEVLDDGPNTRHFKPVLLTLPDLIVPTIIITEVRKFILRERGQAKADTVTRSLSSGVIIELSADIAKSAADLGHKHKLPLADSIIYATALTNSATLWTQDADFEGLPHVKYFPKQKP